MGSRLRAALPLLVVLAAMAALLSFAWLSLERSGVGAVALGRVLALALAGPLVVLATRRRLAGAATALLAVLPAAAYAFGVSLTDMRPGERDFFGPLFAAIGDGFSDFYATKVPFDVAEHAEMEGLVLLAIFLFLLAAGMLAVLRRSLLSGVVFVLGVGWPATIAATIPGATPLRTGAIFLGAVLLLLFLTREGRNPLRALAPATVLGLLLVVAAIGASTSGAVSKAAFLSWQRWNYEPRPDPVGVRYVWSSNYSGIRFPKKETVVLRVKAPDRSLYWRATTLDEFNGVAWRESLVPTGPPIETTTVQQALRDPALPPRARARKAWTRQQVEVEALSDSHLIAAATPIRWETGEPTRVQYTEGGVVLSSEGLRQGERYTVFSYAPSVRPAQLAKLPAEYPSEIRRFLQLAPRWDLPSFGAPHRDRLVSQALAGADPLWAPYGQLYRKARQVVGNARSPYLAAATLELWFRSEGGFAYDEQPEQPADGTPPLVDFVLRTKEGYCQHYAGAMAVMLRLLGVPARVAAGFTAGTYDEDRREWVVTDHNAHTWVEVWFPGYGWLSFDPTPGRGRLAASYSTTSASFTEGLKQLASAGLGLSPSLDRLANLSRIRGRTESGGVGRRAGTGDAGTTAVAESGRPSVAPIVILVLAAAVALVLGVKALRRELRFARRDGRSLATACRRDLAAYLADQRVALPASLTLEELGALVERRFRVDARPFVRAASAARFGPPGMAEAAAHRARRELRGLQRQIRSQLSARARIAGALSFRSLTV